MKKIFAFILATIMVLSLVPASVFAAITKGCEDPHTVDNCEYKYVDKKNATCAEIGYTVYECLACGEQFLDDFVDTYDHNWVDNQKEAGKTNVAVNCKTKTNGKTWVKCSVCKQYPNGAKKAADGYLVTDYRTAHKLGAATGFGCEASQKCSVCSGTFYGWDAETGFAKTEGKHTYEFTKVVTEPERVNGVTTVGSALYNCKDCGTPKYVDIFAPDCDCAIKKYKDLYCTEIVPAKANACEVEGTHAVYRCNSCNQLHSYNKSTDEWKRIAKIEEAIIDAKEHQVDTSKTVTETGCIKKYTCKNCKKEQTEYVHKALVVNTYSEATCVDYGYKVKLCNACGWSESEFVDPNGHDVKTVTVAPTCADYGYTFTYCANETCYVLAGANSMVNAATEYKEISGFVYDVRVENEEGNLVGVQVLQIVRNGAPNNNAHDYELLTSSPVACGVAGYEVYKCKNCGNIYTKTIAAVQHDFDESKTNFVEASCNKAGYIEQWCVNCKQYVTVTTINATPGVHNYESVEIHSNCGTPTASTYYDRNGKLYHTWEVWECTGCATRITVWSNPVTTSSVKTTFESREEAELYHYGAATKVNGEWVYDSQYDNLRYIDGKASTCYSNGYEYYECKHCNQLVYVTLPKADHNVASLLPTAAKAPTCTTAGNIAYYTCYVCGGIVKFDETGKQVNITLADTVLNPHTGDNLVERKKYDCDDNYVGSYWECTTTDSKNKACGKLFTDATASKAYTGKTVDKADDCVWTTIVAYKAATCNKPGTVGIDYCATCGKVKITEDYVSDTNKLNKKKSVTLESIEDAEAYVLKCYTENAPVIDILVSANKEVTANTIDIPMFNHANGAAITSKYVDREDCSTPSFSIFTCSFCAYEYIDYYNPASSSKGHVNMNGQSLVGDCSTLKDIKDKECFYCGETVTFEHNWLTDVISVDYTCKTDGYTYKYCQDCNTREVTGITLASDSYHDDSDHLEIIGSVKDYANNGDYYYVCKVCGVQVGEVVKEDAPKEAGLEIVLSSDADSYIAGSTVKVTVSLESLKGVNVWGISVPVTYDAASFQFLGYTFNSETFPTFVVNEIKSQTINRADGKVSNDAEPVGLISIAANAPENVLVKGSVELVTLEFKVITAYAGQLAISAVEEANYPVGVVTNAFGANYVTKDFTLTVVDEKGKAQTNVIYDATEETLLVDLKAFLNVDDDEYGKVDMADALALYEYIVFEEYDVVADANCDGKVTMEDLAILYNIITGVITVEDIINPAVEEEIQYDEHGNAILPENFTPADGARN